MEGKRMWRGSVLVKWQDQGWRLVWQRIHETPIHGMEIHWGLFDTFVSREDFEEAAWIPEECEPSGGLVECWTIAKTKDVPAEFASETKYSMRLILLSQLAERFGLDPWQRGGG